MPKFWFVYIIESQNGKLYTGIARDPHKRFEEHLSGKGAKFFRSTKPKLIVYLQKCLSKSDALKREIEIKKMSRVKKLKMINEASRSFKNESKS